jgi:hypothetical protein
MNPLDLLTAGSALVNKLLSFIPDPNERAKAAAQAQAELMEMIKTSDSAQNSVNSEEAKSESLFVSGWRPAVGWVCAAALFYQYLLVPVGMYVSFAIGHPLPKPPVLDDTLWQLMFGLLGMGTLRSLDKWKIGK